MASKAEAQQLAGELLRLIPVGQALQSQHNTRMGEAYDEVYAELENIGLALWDTADEIPDEITPHFTAMMAWNKRNIYGISEALYQRLLLQVGDESKKAISRIRMLLSQAYSNADEPTDF
ncbi:MAG: hypothetical protein O7D95_02855 [Betaproteobacteria bacterium]|nr:hypothetical protein [Betaproteobacteria bacterium]